jgi:hypothetical protein
MTENGDTLQVGVLLGMSLAFFLLAVWRFRFDLAEVGFALTATARIG